MRRDTASALLVLLFAGCALDADAELDETSEELQCATCPPVVVQPYTDTTIAVGSLATFTPAAVNDAGNVDVLALSTQGLAMRRLNSATGKWGGRWVQLGAPVAGLPSQTLPQVGPGNGYDRLLPAVARPGTPNADIVYYGFRNQSADFAGRSQTALQSAGPFGPWTWSLTSSQATLPFPTSSGLMLPDHFFSPASPVIAAGEVHLLGSGFIHGEAESGAAIYSRDVIVDRVENLATGAVRWSSLSPPTGNSVAVGPGSAALRAGNPHVFYTIDPVLDTHGEVFYSRVRSYRLEAQWNGADMGSPGTGNIIVGAPATASWSLDGADHINLFVVAFDRDSRTFHLFQRAIGACSEEIWLGCWDGWQDFGAPPDLNGRKFRMTTAAVRYPSPHTVVIDLFGYTEHTSLSNDNSTGPQALVHLSWDGANWVWRATQTAPDGGDVRISSSLAVGQRVGAYPRSSTGRIWEMAILPTGVTQWTDLSLVSPLVAIGP